MIWKQNQFLFCFVESWHLLINGHADSASRRSVFPAVIFFLPPRRLCPGGLSGFCQWDERGKASPADESCFLRRVAAAGVKDPSLLPHTSPFVRFPQVLPPQFTCAPGRAYRRRRSSSTEPPTLCWSVASQMIHGLTKPNIYQPVICVREHKSHLALKSHCLNH